MIKSDIPRRHGRRPAIEFPIRRTIVESGRDFEKVMEAGAKVRCLRCGMTFTVDRLTVHLSDSAVDEMPYVRCELCHFSAPVLQYFDRVISTKPKRQRTRTPEDLGPEIETPEG